MGHFLFIPPFWTSKRELQSAAWWTLRHLNSKATFVQQAGVKYLISTLAPCLHTAICFLVFVFSPRFLEAFAQLCYNMSLCKVTGVVGVAVKHQWMCLNLKDNILYIIICKHKIYLEESWHTHTHTFIGAQQCDLVFTKLVVCSGATRFSQKLTRPSSSHRMEQEQTIVQLSCSCFTAVALKIPRNINVRFVRHLLPRRCNCNCT